jgi:hypothetical protein
MRSFRGALARSGSQNQSRQFEILAANSAIKYGQRADPAQSQRALAAPLPQIDNKGLARHSDREKPKFCRRKVMSACGRIAPREGRCAFEIDTPSLRGAKATKQSIFTVAWAMDCFAEPVIGRAFARPVGSQ